MKYKSGILKKATEQLNMHGLVYTVNAFTGELDVLTVPEYQHNTSIQYTYAFVDPILAGVHSTKIKNEIARFERAS